MAAVFLDIEKAFDTTWQPGLLYKLSKLEFSTVVIKLISSFLSNIKFRISVEGEMSMPREIIQAGVPQGSVLSPALYSVCVYIYINDAPHCPGVHIALFPNDTCIYTTDRKKGYVLRKLQRGLTSVFVV
jgi:hypothetical protein